MERNTGKVREICQPDDAGTMLLIPDPLGTQVYVSGLVGMRKWNELTVSWPSYLHTGKQTAATNHSKLLKTKLGRVRESQQDNIIKCDTKIY